MQIDFKKELEQASKSMIMIHDPELLIRLIIRMLVQKLHIQHAGMLLWEPSKEAYVLNISRGIAGSKIPQGFARFTTDSPIIKIFYNKEYKPLTIDRNALVSKDINQIIWREHVLDNGNGHEIKELLHRVSEQMQMLNTVACVPAFYRDKLMAVLLLGEKENGDHFEQEELDFFAALASDTAMAIRNAQLFDRLKHESNRNHELFLQTINVLGSTIEAKDAYTRGHTERVTDLALDIAHQMADTGAYKFSENFFENLYISGLLHDIGKIAVPESILNKAGDLTEEEYAIMKKHTVKGVEIVQQLSLAQETVDGIRSHHERYDGTGYPEGLIGDEIPMSACIIAVADCYDAMTTDRPYRKGLSKERAVEEIKNKSGIQFHPIPVKAFLELYREKRV